MAAAERKLYNRLKIVLAEKRVENKELAEYLHTDPTTVSKYATNASQPSIPTLYRIAEYLNVEARELLELRSNITSVTKEVKE